MKDHDLPLFRWQPATAEVVPFPCQARIGKIRQAAELIHASQTNRAADARWRQVSDGIVRQMEKAGIAEAVIRAEVRVFADAVCAEVARRSRGAVLYQPDDGDAA